MLKGPVQHDGGNGIETTGDFSTTASDPMADGSPSRDELVRYIRLKLIADGLSPWRADWGSEGPLERGVELLLGNLQERVQLVGHLRCPVDKRIEQFLDRHFAPLKLARPLRLPDRTLVLNHEAVSYTHLRAHET